MPAQEWARRNARAAWVITGVPEGEAKRLGRWLRRRPGLAARWFLVALHDPLRRDPVLARLAALPIEEAQVSLPARWGSAWGTPWQVRVSLTHLALADAQAAASAPPALGSLGAVIGPAPARDA
jgi:hypothetical protein